ncbi:hypothetical protein CBW46_008055 [Paenibacillus xerothermodurans]|uniref:Uncharacterized protein n=1 Tax=Paenibacillus xerothermodurans TaxID=1977292 RepID=A0A2W1N9I7_PAEXE|nr:hypothetical protein CBW46_008055 [Paenibacillus xerothermodurans]
MVFPLTLVDHDVCWFFSKFFINLHSAPPLGKSVFVHRIINPQPVFNMFRYGQAGYYGVNYYLVKQTQIVICGFYDIIYLILLHVFTQKRLSFTGTATLEQTSLAK